MKKKGISLFLFCMAVTFCTAQTDGYQYYCPLDSIKASGFYNIELTPELTAHLKTDYSDLRVVNNSGRWVPHILHLSKSERAVTALYHDLNFTNKESTRAKTILIIEAGQKQLSAFTIVIRNTAAERFCTLSGSDDRENWFVINDSILLNPAPSISGTTISIRIDFPPGNYKYFKIVINNNNKDPFDIKKVLQQPFVPANTNSEIKQITNPVCAIKQKDSGKNSYIRITQLKAYHFDFINIKLSGTKYYYRKVDLFIPVAGGHSFSNPGKLLQSFFISNNSSLTFNVPLMNDTVFYLCIHNEDNLPLLVNEIRTAVSSHYITAYLDKGDQYKLIIGNSSASSPDYDLARMDTVIQPGNPFINIGKITALEINAPLVISGNNNKRMLWAAIIITLLVLAFFTQKMIKEVDKRKQYDNI